MQALRNMSAGKIVAYLFLALFTFFTLLPLWMALKTGLTHPRELFVSTQNLLPAPPTIGNFQRVLGLGSDVTLSGGGASINFALALRNSIVYTVLVVAGQLFFSAMAGYAFARIRFPGREILFYAFIGATMIPSIVLFIPNFVLIRQLGWINTFQGMVAPSILIAPFAVFFLRQFFLSSPRELEEAARLDGCSAFQVFWKVALPLQRGPIATLAILLSISAWNDFFWPFLVGREQNVKVLAVALTDFISQLGGVPDWSGLMAAVTISIIPVLIALIFFGRQIVESLQTSGMK